MAATLLTNVVYPVYTRRRYIRHFTPGKWWDCLYTWDSGFIALGLLELDIERAIDCLNAYTTPPGDPQAAFIHHGSPAPIQIYAFLELWNRTQDRALLEYFYPRLRQMYLFLAGRLGSSTTRKMKSGLLKTWDYFYNSAGWDDYPPQVHVHRHGLEPTVTPVINTSHALRSARILQMAARALGLSDDITDYETDIAAWTDALNRYSWDGEAGYFSYVTHDDEGRPTGILRHESGANYDMGLDGASPLFAGICNAEQEAALIARLSFLSSACGRASVFPLWIKARPTSRWMVTGMALSGSPINGSSGKRCSTKDTASWRTASAAQHSMCGSRKWTRPTTASSISSCSRAAARGGTISAGCPRRCCRGSARIIAPAG